MMRGESKAIGEHQCPLLFFYRIIPQAFSGEMGFRWPTQSSFHSLLSIIKGNIRSVFYRLSFFNVERTHMHTIKTINKMRAYFNNIDSIFLFVLYIRTTTSNEQLFELLVDLFFFSSILLMHSTIIYYSFPSPDENENRFILPDSIDASTWLTSKDFHERRWENVANGNERSWRLLNRFFSFHVQRDTAA